MKKVILVGALIAGFAYQANAQEFIDKATNEQLMAAIKRDFPELVFKDKTVLQNKDGIDRNYAGVSKPIKKRDIEYNALIRGEKRTVSAQYDSNFKLMHAIVRRNNVTPNKEISRALYTAYPGWVISKDSYRAIYGENGQKVERFKFYLTKGTEKQTVHTDIHGKILTPIKEKNM
jgi:hypothetical protein